MPARKAGKKGAAKKSATKSRKAGLKRTPILRQDIITAILRRREWVMYAQPIFQVAASGNIAEMRRAAEVTRTHVEDVQKSLAQLDAAIRAGGR
jgi:hypothetical protein